MLFVGSMNDALRPNDEVYKRIYRRGFVTWYALYQKAIPLSWNPPIFELEELIPQHPVFPSWIEIGGGSPEFLDVTGYSTWGTTVDGDCPLPPFRTKYTLRVSTNRPIAIGLSSEPSFGFTKWFGEQGSHLLQLTLAWAYVFSARWGSIMPNAVVKYAVDKPSTGGGVGDTENHQPFQIDIGDASSAAVRWWFAILVQGEGWEAFIPGDREVQFRSPWSVTLQSDSHFKISGGDPNDTPLDSAAPATWHEAANFISDYVAHHRVADQSRAAFMAALMLPTSQTLTKQVLLPTPKLSSPVGKLSPLPHDKLRPWGSNDEQLDRLLTLSCNGQGITSLLSSVFIEPSIPCNVCGAWVQGMFAALEQEGVQDPHVLLHVLINRSPQLGFLWFGAFLVGIQVPIMKWARAGLARVDLQIAVWTNTFMTFIQLPPTPPNSDKPRPSLICRSDEARLMFLAQAENHKGPPLVPFEPFGETAIRDCILEVQIHSQCGSLHGLWLLGWTWEHEDAVCWPSKIMDRPEQATVDESEDRCVIDFGKLDRERDCSETATRSMFLWLRGEDGYPVAEREIYRHEWINKGANLATEDPLLDGDWKSGRDQRVGTWMARMATGRCDSI